MERHQIIAEKVQKRTARPSVNLTGLAHILGISRQALARRLNGDVAWHYDELERLAREFNMTVDELVNENHSSGTPAAWGEQTEQHPYVEKTRGQRCRQCGAPDGEHYTHCIHHHG